MFVAAAMTLSGCRGDGNDDDAGTAPAASATTRAMEDSGDGTATPEAVSSATPEDTGGPAELREIRDRFIASTFSATYQSSGPEPAEYRIHKDGARFRLDINDRRDGQPFTRVLIVTPSAAYLCVTGEPAEALGGDASGTCIQEASSAADPFEGLLSAFEVSASVRLLDTSERTIAGRAASCYTTEDTSSGASGTICVDAGGALLAVESSGAGGISVVATAVVDTVTDADFAPPFTVLDIGG
jgi:hypothetical protein